MKKTMIAVALASSSLIPLAMAKTASTFNSVVVKTHFVFKTTSCNITGPGGSGLGVNYILDCVAGDKRMSCLMRSEDAFIISGEKEVSVSYDIAAKDKTRILAVSAESILKANPRNGTFFEIDRYNGYPISKSCHGVYSLQ